MSCPGKDPPIKVTHKSREAGVVMVNTSEYAWTRDGRMYWNLRNRLGQFVNRLGFNKSAREQQLEAWRAYLEARRQRAEEETRGHLVKAHGWARVNVSRLFAPGASLHYASEELVEWFARHGRTLSFREFAAQCAA